MKYVPTFEQFVFTTDVPVAFDGSNLKVGGRVISADGYSGIIVSKENTDGKIVFRDHLGVHHLVESHELINDEPINEAEMQWWEITKGILAADAIVAGMAIAGGGLAVAAVMFSEWFHKISDKVQSMRKDAAIKAKAQSIAVKFNEDQELNGMMKKLQQYPYMKPLLGGKSVRNAAEKNNKERSKLLREISAYVKSKLTPEEIEFFVEINKVLRNKPLTNNDGEKVEEDLQQMADAVLDPSNSNAETSLNKDPNRTVGTGTYTPVRNADQNIMTKGLFKTADPASGGWNPFVTTSN
jgi:hypothetical protein